MGGKLKAWAMSEVERIATLYVEQGYGLQKAEQRAESEVYGPQGPDEPAMGSEHKEKG